MINRNRKTGWLSLTLAVALLLALMAGSVAQAQQVNTDLSGTFTVWFWDNAAITNSFDRFQEVYPNINIEPVDVSGADDATTKVLSALAAGTELPDMVVMEIDYRYKLISAGVWENLEAEPYNYDRSEMLDYLIPLNSDKNGNIVAIDSLICTAGIAFKRPLAQKYLGTSDPAEVEAMFPTWQAMLDKGIELKAQYPDMYFFPTDEDVFRVVLGQNSISFDAEDGDFTIEAFKDAVHWVYEFKKAGLINDHLMWTPSWYSTFADDTHLFTACPSWMPHFQIKENDPNYKGRWGLILPPGGGLNWGGSSYAIYSGSEKKDLVWAYIKWALDSKEGALGYKETNGFYSPYKPMYEDPDYFFMQTEAFAEQNIGDLLFNRVLETLDMRKISQYDAAARVGFNQWFALFDVGHDGLTEEKALEMLEEEIRNNIS